MFYGTKVHAMLIGHLKSKMPSMFGREAAQKKLIKNMDEVARNSRIQFQNRFMWHCFENAVIITHCVNASDCTLNALLFWRAKVFRSVQREHGLPFGDFPDMEKFKEQVQELDFSRFPKLDLKMLQSMDTVLSNDVPALMAQFPAERYDEAAMYSEQAAAVDGGFDAMPAGGGAAA